MKEKSAEFEEKFIENQEKDRSFLDELKNLERPVKIFTDFVSVYLVYISYSMIL